MAAASKSRIKRRQLSARTMPGAWLARPSGPASSTMIRAISILLAEQRPLGPGRIDALEDLVPDLRGVSGVRADGRDVVQRGAECSGVGPTLRLGPGNQATGGVDDPSIVNLHRAFLSGVAHPQRLHVFSESANQRVAERGAGS